jgi:hypothetical protein
MENIMSKFLALGFLAEHGLCCSREVSDENAQIVAIFLHTELATWFDQILLVKNGYESPSVVRHWNIDKDYRSLPD